MASEDYTRDSARTYGRTWPRTVAEPSLFLNFTSATALDPRITFSRGSQATLFDSTGTLVYAKHNLLTFSEAFDNAAWTKSQLQAFGSGSIANATTAPDGTVTADKIVENTTTNTHLVQTVPTYELGVPYTYSVFAKAAERTFVQIRITAGATFSASFNLLTGVASQVTANTTAAIFDYGNGWYRCCLTFSPTVAGGGASRIGLMLDATTSNYLGDGTSGLFIWGAQLNLANMEGGVTSSLSTYYPTTTAAYYAPRFDYNPSTLQPLGLLIEEQRTNSIRNNTMQGAVAGTPGTLPTNWTSATSGLTRTIVGTGTSNGITYIDVRFAGTSTNTFAGVYFETSNGVAAANGQTWTPSAWVSVVGGSTANITSAWLQLDQYSNVPAYLSSRAGTNVVSLLNSTPTRYSVALTTNNASTAFVVPSFSFFFANGAAIDITLRIGLPQLELGAFATSVIPTTTTALTRNADVASMTGTNFSSWYNASEGTIISTTQLANTVAANRAGYDINDNSTNNRIIFRVLTTGGGDQSTIRSGGITQVQDATATAPTTAVRKSAIAYKVNDFAFVANAGAVVADNSGAVPVAPTQILIGFAQGGSEFTSGYIQRLSFYPQRLPNTTLQALTA